MFINIFYHLLSAVVVSTVVSVEAFAQYPPEDYRHPQHYTVSMEYGTRATILVRVNFVSTRDWTPT